MLSLVACILIINSIYIAKAAAYNVLSWQTIVTNPFEPKERADIPLYVWYPNSTNTENKFPVFVFGHCLFGQLDYYDYVWQSAVPNGYIVVMPRRFDDTKDERALARDLRYSLDWVRDNCTQCPFRNLIGDKSFISGHSMGAGSAVLILGNHWLGQPFKYEFDAGMTLSACGSFVQELSDSAKNITKPIVLFDGSHDCMCPPSEWADIYYTEISNTSNICKYEILITNGTHCNFAELDPAEDASCLGLEESNCPANEQYYIPESEQLNITIKYMNLFMNATLYQYNTMNPYNVLNVEMENDKNIGIIAKGLSNSCN